MGILTKLEFPPLFKLKRMWRLKELKGLAKKCCEIIFLC